MHARFSSKIAALNRLNRPDRSISKEIESQRIAIEVANDVKRILRDETLTTATTEKQEKK
jgi:hypothetical protein